MEKLGVAKTDLVAELKDKYHYLKEKEATLVKTANDATRVQSEIKEVKAKLDELSAE